MSQLHDVLIPGDHGLNGIDGLSPTGASARIGEVIDGAKAAAEAGGASDRRACDTEAHAVMPEATFTSGAAWSLAARRHAPADAPGGMILSLAGACRRATDSLRGPWS